MVGELRYAVGEKLIGRVFNFYVKASG